MFTQIVAHVPRTFNYINLIKTKLMLSPPAQYNKLPRYHTAFVDNSWKLSRNTNKKQVCNRIYYSKVFWRLNMFQAAHHSSSGALNCICSLWFIYPYGDRPLPRLSGKSFPILLAFLLSNLRCTDPCLSNSWKVSVLPGLLLIYKRY
jgi:hypothetical protein